MRRSFLLITVLFFSFSIMASAQTATGQAPAPTAQSKTANRGTFTVFSRKDNTDDKKKDTVVLWTSTDIQENEEFDSLVVIAGDVNFYGRAKDLVVIGGRVVLQDGSEIQKSLVVVGGKLIQKDGAKVTEQVYFELPEHLPSWIAAISPVMSAIDSDGAAYLKRIVTAVLICLFGALLYVIMPNMMQMAEASAQKNPFESGFWAFGGVLMFFPGLAILIISLVGLIFIPLYFAVYFVIYLFVGYVMTANILGHFLPPRRSVVMPPLRMCYGVFILELVSAVPYVGPLAIYVCSFLAAGAMIRTIYTSFRQRSSAKSIPVAAEPK